MSRTQLSGVLLGFLALLLVLSMLLLNRSEPAALAGSRDSPVGPLVALDVAAGIVKDPAGESFRRPALADEDVALVTLEVLLVDGDGAPLPGAIQWVAGEAAASLPGLGPAAPWLHLRPTGVPPPAVQLAPDGRIELRVPSGQPVWIRATTDRSPASARYRRVDRVPGDQEVRIVFGDDDPRRIHVLVYGAELDLPAAGCEVQVRAYGKEEATWRGKTDAAGYLVAPAPSCGTVSVGIDGAPADDREAAAVCNMEGVGGDLVVVLAAPEPLHDCSFRLESAIETVMGGVPPAVIAVRTNGRRQCVRLVTHALPMGSSNHGVELPAGDYAVVPLPQGCGRAAGGMDLVQVRRSGEEFAIAFERASARVLELVGIPDTDMPVQVRAEVPEDLFAVAEERIWIGPTQWRRRREAVSSWLLPARLAAIGRSSIWISTEAVPAADPSEDVTSVPMMLGAAVEVVAPIPVGDGGDVIAEGRSRGVATVRLMRRAMVQTRSGLAPRLRTVLYVPAGEVSVTLSASDGRTLWSRLVTVRGRAFVEVP